MGIVSYKLQVVIIASIAIVKLSGITIHQIVRFATPDIFHYQANVRREILYARLSMKLMDFV